MSLVLVLVSLFNLVGVGRGGWGEEGGERRVGGGWGEGGGEVRGRGVINASYSLITRRQALL